MVARASTQEAASLPPWLFLNPRPRQRICAFSEREILNDLATAKNEAIGESSARPFGRALQPHPSVEVHDNLISVHEEPFRVATSLSPSAATFRDVLFYSRDPTIGTRCWKSLGLDA